MNPTSPLPAILSLLIAVTTAFFLAKKFGAPTTQGRFSSIDGLRGYLAFFVFMHHSCIWYFYLKTDQWKVPPSNLYTHFGQSSVALFFMVTGFLFFSKLIDGRKKSINWGRLFISRILRLVPLYIFVMALLFLTVAILTNGMLNDDLFMLIKGVIKWLGFTILGRPDLNGIEHTSRILSSVTWSLPYEWFFYFSLPLLAFTVKVTPPLPYLLLGIAGAVSFYFWQPTIDILVSFLGGIAASFLVRLDIFRLYAKKRISSIICISCIVIAVAFYPTAFSNIPILLLSISFTLIACGNTIFGLLASPTSRFLGDMAYSIYLLHGLTLFIVFYFIIGITESKALSSEMHWLIISALTPFLIIFSFFTFRFIERPFMEKTPIVTSWIETALRKNRT